jgi:hypothetical protein
MACERIPQISICLCVFLVVAVADSVLCSAEHDTTSRSGAKPGVFRLNTMCGPNCVWQIARASGKDCSPRDIAKFAGTDPFRGTTIQGLVEAARKIGLQAKAVKTNIKVLAQDPAVAILLLTVKEVKHYVILDKAENGNVRLLDGDGFRNISVHQLESIWQGHAILIGGHEGTGADSLERYFGTGLQISGLLILVAVATYGIKCAYSSLSKCQYSNHC